MERGDSGPGPGPACQCVQAIELVVISRFLHELHEEVEAASVDIDALWQGVEPVITPQPQPANRLTAVVVEKHPSLGCTLLAFGLWKRNRKFEKKARRFFIPDD